MPNLSDLDLDLIIGQIAYEDGEIPIDIDHLTVAFELSELKIPKIMHTFAKFGSCEFANIGNSVIAAAGVYTAGTSALRFSVTKNRIAQVFYTFGFIFGGTAVISGSFS